MKTLNELLTSPHKWERELGKVLKRNPTELELMSAELDYLKQKIVDNQAHLSLPKIFLDSGLIRVLTYKPTKEEEDERLQNT